MMAFLRCQHEKVIDFKHYLEVSYLVVDMTDLEALQLDVSRVDANSSTSKTNVESNHHPVVEGWFARIQEEHPTSYM